MKTQVQFSLVSYWGGYWAMMVTNPPGGGGFDPEPHPGFSSSCYFSETSRVEAVRFLGKRRNQVCLTQRRPGQDNIIWADLD
ncbi:hypothetical protein Hanom_Chr08g00698691 [Helianthus anomalus]